MSFQLWLEKGGVRHSYFEKDMRAQVLTMKRSSQSEQSKYSILVNELTRRFEVMDKDISVAEKTEIVDHYTQQLRNSGYSSDQIRDIVQSSLKGMLRKEIINKNRENRYRSGESTLEEREKKKLLESTTWFRQNGQDKYIGEQLDIEGKVGKYIGMSNWREKGTTGGRKNTRKMMEVEGKWKIMGVLFIQHTHNSELAKRL